MGFLDVFSGMSTGIAKEAVPAISSLEENKFKRAESAIRQSDLSLRQEVDKRAAETHNYEIKKAKEEEAWRNKVVDVTSIVKNIPTFASNAEKEMEVQGMKLTVVGDRYFSTNGDLDRYTKLATATADLAAKQHGLIAVDLVNTQNALEQAIASGDKDAFQKLGVKNVDEAKTKLANVSKHVSDILTLKEKLLKDAELEKQKQLETFKNALPPSETKKYERGTELMKTNASVAGQIEKSLIDFDREVYKTQGANKRAEIVTEAKKEVASAGQVKLFNAATKEKTGKSLTTAEKTIKNAYNEMQTTIDGLKSMGADEKEITGQAARIYKKHAANLNKDEQMALGYTYGLFTPEQYNEYLSSKIDNKEVEKKVNEGFKPTSKYIKNRMGK